jgi:hypothetical protein
VNDVAFAGIRSDDADTRLDEPSISYSTLISATPLHWKSGQSVAGKPFDWLANGRYAGDGCTITQYICDDQHIAPTQSLRNSSGSFAIFTAMRRAADRAAAGLAEETR